MQDYYTEYFELGQQKISYNLFNFKLSEDDPVHTLKKIMQSLDYTKLLETSSKRGRTGYNPIMLLAVLYYASMRGVRSVDKIVDLCQRDLGFIYLTKGQTPKRDAFYDFKKNKLLTEIQEDLHYQFIKRLKAENLVNLETLYIDGTKIEADANRYTFVWRGAINYHLAGLLDGVATLYKDYNTLMHACGYDKKYALKEETMFIIKGMDKVREVIKKNRERKLNKKKKLSNNKVIEIDNMCPAKLFKLQRQIAKIAENEGIIFVKGKGKRKTQLQKLYETTERYGVRLLDYQTHFKKMGADRNSYSKTDVDATFMRMKEDHMMNGQLKAAYNVQHAIENYFIIHTSVSNNRTDYETLIPLVEKHQTQFGESLKAVVADSGYCSEKNLTYLETQDIRAYIKLQTHEKKKTRAYHRDIGKHYNMTYVDEEVPYYLCHDQRKLSFVKQTVSLRNNQTSTYAIYQSESCEGCLHKARCLYKYDESKHLHKNKMLKVNHKWERLKAKAEENIQSKAGVLHRQIRSVQTEGSFGDKKQNRTFRRFQYRGKEMVYREQLLDVMGFNLMKYHRFKHGKIRHLEAVLAEKTA